MKRCSKCILPENYPGLSFQNGVCLFCTDHVPFDVDSTPGSQYEKFIQQSRSLESTFQAIVPFSGGKDSSYALYHISQELQLRTLAINFDNGFQSETARENITLFANLPNVHLLTVRPAWSFLATLYRGFLKSVGEFCTVCNAVGYYMILFKILETQQPSGCKIPVYGAWSQRYEAMPSVYSFDFHYFLDVLAESGTLDTFNKSPYYNEQVVSMLCSLGDPRSTSIEEDFPVMYAMLPDMIPWNPIKISLVLEKTGWISEGNPGYENHFDCTAYPAAYSLETAKYGFSQRTISLSAMVRDGLINREKAIELETLPAQQVETAVHNFLQKLDLSWQEINWQGKWHTDRRNNETGENE